MLRCRISPEPSAAGQLVEAPAPMDAAAMHPGLVSPHLGISLSRDRQAEDKLQRKAKLRPFWHRLAFRLFVLALTLRLLQTFVVEASVVPTGSMEGTILVGDHLLLDKLLYAPVVPLLNRRLPALRTIHRGDIVVFRYPLHPEEAFLKRVAAVAGDELEIRDGVVYINSHPVNEPYAVHRFRLFAAHEQMRPIVIPPGKLFVMGDNRDNSSDSREWGLVPVENVIGEPILIYWSYNAPTARWLDQSFASQLGFYASIAGNFFSGTRWSRTGMLL
ncbi:MAG TPA: signal peptidase I [Terriglobales bacterium]|nr:signal peptidase I [Terriglobales bacterium]